MALGWTVRLDRADAFEPVMLFDVAVPEADKAEASVRSYAHCTQADAVSVVAPLTQTTIEAQDLKNGDVKPWPSDSKVRWGRG